MREERPGLRRAIGALQYPNYRLYYVALLVASIGGQLQTTANLWQIYELTGSALHLGLTGLARAIPVIGFSLVGGVIADRVDRRRFTVILQVVAGLVALVLAGLTALGQVAIWHLYGATLVTATVQALGIPARTAMIPNLVPRPQLLNALALNQSIHEIAVVLGPSVAGVCIGAFGLVPTYAGNGVAHVVTVFALLLMQMGPVAARPRESALHSLVEGLSFVRERSIILTLLVLDSTASLLGSYRVLLPLFAAQLGVGAQGLGFMLSAPAVGALLGGAVLISLGDVRYKGLYVAGGILVSCAALVVLAWSPWFIVALGACGVLGFCDSVQRVPRATIIQSTTPDALRGRLVSFQTMLGSGSSALGQIWSGALAAALGPAAALVVGAAACAGVVVGFVVRRRDLRDPQLGTLQETEVPLAEPAPRSA